MLHPSGKGYQWYLHQDKSQKDKSHYPEYYSQQKLMQHSTKEES
jgi:hypothetical protein